MDIRGSFAYPTSYWPRVIDLISSGKIPAGKVVTSRVSLDTAVRDGFDKLVVPGNSHLKIMIDLTA
jgi:(R,R)-butanediol dehydrogenase/meso-butanediol dehydrogenase/diacetyl reductase